MIDEYRALVKAATHLVNGIDESDMDRVDQQLVQDLRAALSKLKNPNNPCLCNRGDCPECGL
jgi:hypothetical protein